MKNKLLLLGASGKMGTALSRAFSDDYDVIPKTSAHFDGADEAGVKALIEETRPHLIVNAVALLGIDRCDQEPELAFKLNTLLPKTCAIMAKKVNACLIHLSTAAVFDGKKNDFYHESDIPSPLNIYGATKLAGDAMVKAHLKEHYIFRIPIIFGPSSRDDQFTEIMLKRAVDGQPLRIADDVYDSPSYSLDVAGEIRQTVVKKSPFGLYHITNRGKASLYELVSYFVEKAGLNVPVQRASYRDFPFVGLKNTNTPMTTIKLKPLRSWQRAADDYLALLRKENRL